MGYTWDILGYYLGNPWVVVRDGLVVSEAVQVCYDLGNPLTRERELKGLLSVMQAYGLDEGLLLTDS